MQAVAVRRSPSPAVNHEFASYFAQSLRCPFTLDLSTASLLDVIQACIKTKEKLSPKYGKTLSCLVNNLRQLEALYHVRIMPVQVTDIFWTMFVSFLLERGLSRTTVSTLSNQLRSILRWGARYQAPLSPSFDAVRIPKASSNKIALSADEVSNLYHFDIDRFYADRRPQFRRHMHRIRDMFVLSCNLYQRYSDMVRIGPSCFDDGVFSIVQLKTGGPAKVNLLTEVIDPKMTKTILKRYEYTAPFRGDISSYNHYLKILAKDAGLTDPVRFEEKILGEMRVVVRPRYQLIGSHTARRTAVTLAFLRGMNLHTIRRCSGHQSFEMVEQYIKDE